MNGDDSGKIGHKDRDDKNQETEQSEGRTVEGKVREETTLNKGKKWWKLEWPGQARHQVAS